MRRAVPALILLSVGTSPLAGQAAQSAPAANNASVAATRQLWEMMTNYVTQAAKDMPEDKYGYRPTAEVRSFGEIIGHVAGAQNMICAAALGDAPRAEDEVEKSVKDKAGLIRALEQSTEYCGRAYQQNDAATRAAIKLFGMDMTRFHALVLNATHNGEHYGNLVTYLRINGMVPPSSRGGM
jgi:uncharacterized damage-inducible protein DinB